MEHISKLFIELSKGEIRYLVCGGLAVNIYGIPRTTADIDLLVDFEERIFLNLKKYFIGKTISRFYLFF